MTAIKFKVQFLAIDIQHIGKFDKKINLLRLGVSFLTP